MSEPDWALVHLKKHIEKTHSGKKEKMEEGNREGEITVQQGGIVCCPGGHRTWTVSLFEGELKLFCTDCKRCFSLHTTLGGGTLIILNKIKFENVSVGVE